MKKLIIDRDEDIAEVVDKVIEIKDSEISIVVPTGSVLGKSPRNFHLLRREAQAAGKQVEVESVDEQILAFAKDAGIAGSHPLLRRAGGGSVSDIVAVSEESEMDESVVIPAKKEIAKKEVSKAKSETSEPVKIHVRTETSSAMVTEHESSADDDDDSDDDEEENEARAEKNFFGGNRFFTRNPAVDEDDDDDSPSGKRGKGIWIAAGIAVVIIAALFVVTKVFAHATVTIDFQKTPWQYQTTLTAETSASQVDTVNGIIPAQLFSEQKNVTQSFQATGSGNSSAKATGVITIYNDYSSAPQQLVATTRFVAPDGNIFRLVSGVTVPGAKVSGSVITPSSVTAQVIADQPGASYNEGPISKLTIPGFQGTPKYNGFYGALLSGTSGGGTSGQPYATAADISAAEASTTAMLESALQGSAVMSIPSNFEIIPGATNVVVGTLSVSTSTNASGDFTVFGEATYQAIGFDQSALEALYLLPLAQATEASSSFSSIALTYASATPNFTKGTMTFSVSATATLEPALSVPDFKVLLAGQSISNARADVSGLPQLQDAKISVWPVWLWSMPSDVNKIDVQVN